jgi:predicted exporter
MTKYRNALLWLILIATVVGFAISRFSSGNITVLSDLLSLVGQHSVFDQKIKATASAQQQKLIIVLNAKNKETAQLASKKLASDLIGLNSIKAATRLPFDQAQIDKITEVYKDHPFTLLNDDYAKAIEAGESEKLTEYFITTLLQPGNPFVELTIEKDPTLGLANALQQKLATQSHWLIDGDALYQLVEDQYYYPIFIDLAQVNLGVNQSVAVEKQINQQLDKVQSATIYRSGLLFHIAGSTAQAQAEITLFGVISTLIIIAATILVFRSITPILVIVLIMSISIVFGAAGLAAFVNELHLITFIFAISLIGISVDYGFHVLSAAAFSQNILPNTTQSLTQYLAPAMLMGAVTTILGYCAMLLMPIDALHQITVFMIFGLIAALATALFWLAPFYDSKDLRLSKAVISGITKLTDTLAPHRKKRYLGAVVGCFVVLFIFAGGQFNFDDNVKSLNSSSMALIKQEQKIQQLMGYSSYPRYIVFEGKNEQSVLTTMTQVTKRLDGTLSRAQSKVQSLSLWVPPATVQQQQKDQVKAFYQQGKLSLMESYIEPAQFQALIGNLDKPLQNADWPDELTVLAQPLWQDNNKTYGMISYYSQLSETQQQSIKSGLEDVSFFDQPQRLSQSLASVRSSLMAFFVVAAAAFALILVLRYGINYGLLAFVTPVFAAIGSLLISQLLISSLTIFNLLACLLIVALAIDYIVFFNEQGHKKHVVLAVVLSAISSIAAFGMMTFSQTPAVYHFGLSTLIGIILAVILSFITPLRPRKHHEH